MFVCSVSLSLNSGLCRPTQFGREKPPPSCVLGDDDSTDEMSEVKFLFVSLCVCLFVRLFVFSVSFSLSELRTLSANAVRKGKVLPPPSCVLGDDDSTDEMSEVRFLFCLSVCLFFYYISLCFFLCLSLFPNSIGQCGPERKSTTASLMCPW